MKALFLDDDPFRREVISNYTRDYYPGIDLHIAKDALEAKGFLGSTHFDFVSLDHDLGGETFVDSNGSNTGAEVARFIAAMDSPPKIIRVHSYNLAGARNMIQTLSHESLNHFMLRVFYKPFNGRLFD